jgi:hypothetical protein
MDFSFLSQLCLAFKLMGLFMNNKEPVHLTISVKLELALIGESEATVRDWLEVTVQAVVNSHRSSYLGGSLARLIWGQVSVE